MVGRGCWLVVVGCSCVFGCGCGWFVVVGSLWLLVVGCGCWFVICGLLSCCDCWLWLRLLVVVVGL